ncbi:MAG TPA: acetoacetate--CoA ligase [Gammaproteobacteria bacterium]
MSRPLWTPTEARASASLLHRFIREHAPRLDGAGYDALHAWSVSKPDEFWGAMADFAGIRFAAPPSSVVADFDRMPGARWFEGAELGFADNLLRPDFDGPALIAIDETGRRKVLDRRAVRAQAAAVAASLEALGVGPGDRVAGLLPNCAETVVAMLAAASIGAVWTSCSPDFGARGVLERFGQTEPKVLFAADGYFYGGKRIDTLAKTAEVAAALPGLRAVVVVGFCDPRPEIAAIPAALRFDEIARETAHGALAPRALPFAHPLYILYSSGTTGPPKCIVHGAGGTLLQHQKEHILHCDIRPNDVVFYFTTCGWMMWHWLASALAAGATLVLYDGSPFHPDPGVLWRAAERERIAVFGTSAKYLAALEQSGYRPRDQVDLAALKSVLSTGSPLAPSSFDYVYDAIKKDLQLSSISGGTDIISCFALGNPMLPVYRGELQCRGLGMDVQVYDDAGRPVQGRKGELVCASPFPSMPLGFWNDPDGAKYRAAYFERFPGVWCHGDYAELTPHGGLIIHGRSDAVLNPGGVRIGTAEIYRIVEQFPEVAECVAVGQEWDGDTRIVLFVRLMEGRALDGRLVDTIRAALKREASPRHVPAKILAVTDIPRTLNGKISETAVRDAVHGRDVPNRDALANPEALDQYRNRPELAS